MAGDQHQWDGAAFDAFARSSRGRAQHLGRAASSAADIGVPRWTFGRLPVSGELFDAYDQLRQLCLDGLSDAGEAMDAVADGIDQTHRAYTDAEDANVDQIGGGS